MKVDWILPADVLIPEVRTYICIMYLCIGGWVCECECVCACVRLWGGWCAHCNVLKYAEHCNVLKYAEHTL